MEILKRKQLIKIGESKLDPKLCIPFTKPQDCGACAEHCPSGAIRMEPRDDLEGRQVPVINSDYCIGCGICQKVCPVRPERAIIVEPKQVHSVAYDPRPAEGAGPRQASEEDFPF